MSSERHDGTPAEGCDSGGSGHGVDAPTGGHKARHADRNTGEKEPALPKGRAVNPANPTAVPSDSPASTIKDGGEATRAHNAGDGPAPADYGATPQSRDAGEGLGKHLQQYDAGRLARQCNGGGTIRTKGGKR